MIRQQLGPARRHTLADGYIRIWEWKSENVWCPVGATLNCRWKEVIIHGVESGVGRNT